MVRIRTIPRREVRTRTNAVHLSAAFRIPRSFRSLASASFGLPRNQRQYRILGDVHHPAVRGDTVRFEESSIISIVTHLTDRHWNSNQNPAANPPKSNLSFEREPDAAVRRFTSEFYGSDPNHSAPRGSNSNQCRSFKRCVPNSSIISIACVGEFRAPSQSEAIQNPR